MTFLSSPSNRKGELLEMTHSSYWAEKKRKYGGSGSGRGGVGEEDEERRRHGGRVIFATKEAKSKFTVS